MNYRRSKIVIVFVNLVILKLFISLIKEISDSKDLKVYYEAENGKIIEETFNLVVLSVGMQPNQQAKDVCTDRGKIASRRSK